MERKILIYAVDFGDGKRFYTMTVDGHEVAYVSEISGLATTLWYYFLELEDRVVVDFKPLHDLERPADTTGKIKLPSQLAWFRTCPLTETEIQELIKTLKEYIAEITRKN